MSRTATASTSPPTAGKTWTQCRPGGDAAHRQDPHPPARTRTSSTSRRSATPGGRTRSAASTARRTAAQTWEQVLFRERASRARSTSRWTRTTRASSTPPSGRRSATRTQLISGGPGSGIFKSTDGGDTWTETDPQSGAAEGRPGQDRRRRLARARRAASGRWSRRRTARSSARTTAARRGSGSARSGDLRRRAWYYMHIYRRPARRRRPSRCSTSQSGSRPTAARPSRSIPTPHGDNHDLWIDPKNPHRMIQGNDGGACVSFNGGAIVVHDLQPADRAVLPRHHRRPRARTASTARSRTTRRSPCRAARRRGAITRAGLVRAGRRRERLHRRPTRRTRTSSSAARSAAARATGG